MADQSGKKKTLVESPLLHSAVSMAAFNLIMLSLPPRRLFLGCCYASLSSIIFYAVMQGKLTFRNTRLSSASCELTYTHGRHCERNTVLLPDKRLKFAELETWNRPTTILPMMKMLTRYQAQ